MRTTLDITGRRYGKLTAVRLVCVKPGKLGAFWLLRCSCGRFAYRLLRTLTATKRSGYVSACDQCSRESSSAAGRAKGEREAVRHASSDYMKDFRVYRANFTPEQWERYETLLRGRRGPVNEAEAVDIIMRNTDLLLARDNSDLHHSRNFNKQTYALLREIV